MCGPASGVRNYLALAKIYCKLISRIRAGFRHLIYGDIKQFSPESGRGGGGGGGGGRARAPKDQPLAN